jgi:hypothetical protein
VTAPEPDDRTQRQARTLTDIMARWREHRTERYGQAAGDWPVVVLAEYTEAELPPHWVRAQDEAQRDPIRYALKAQVREIGWIAYCRGGIDLMVQMYFLAAEAGADGAVIDKWWSMIGDWDRDIWLS